MKKEELNKYAVLVTNQEEFKAINAINNRLRYEYTYYNRNSPFYIYLKYGGFSKYNDELEIYTHITYNEYLQLINKPSKLKLTFW